MSGDNEARVAACHAVARAWLERTLGVDLRRGGVARSVERHVAERVAGDARLTADDYRRDLDVPGSRSSQALLVAGTVTHSWLFRDPAQLEAVRRSLLERPRGPLGVWVAGCASGEEVYTVAAIALSVGHDVRVLGTDVNGEALARAARGTYDAWSARDVPSWARRYLAAWREGGARASEELRARVSFSQRSLIDEAPPSDRGGWELIFCRNVLIYFDRARAQRIAHSLARSLARCERTPRARRQ